MNDGQNIAKQTYDRKQNTKDKHVFNDTSEPNITYRELSI